MTFLGFGNSAGSDTRGPNKFLVKWCVLLHCNGVILCWVLSQSFMSVYHRVGKCYLPQNGCRCSQDSLWNWVHHSWCSDIKITCYSDDVINLRTYHHSVRVTYVCSYDVKVRALSRATTALGVSWVCRIAMTGTVLCNVIVSYDLIGHAQFWEKCILNKGRLFTLPLTANLWLQTYYCHGTGDSRLVILIGKVWP